jgi:threonine dehydratase
MSEVTLREIRRARHRMDDPEVVQRTPVERSRSLSEITGCDVRLKMEHLQRTGSFKTRGAYNKLARLTGGDGTDGKTTEDEADGEQSPERANGEPTPERVVAASAGNHAQGVALAATSFGVDSTIVMPETAPQAKIDATRGYGATVELVGQTFAEAMDHAQSLTDDPDTVFVHAYDDRDVIAGQGTLGLELLDQLDDIDAVIVPIGGGGLISGVATAIGEVAPEIEIIGVQAAGAATVPDSLDAGEPVEEEDPDTIADGIATGGISELTFEHIEKYVDTVCTVTDNEIAWAVLTLLERAKQLVEGAGAVSVAALRSSELDLSGKRVVPLLCGGNIDVNTLQEVLTRAQRQRSQQLRLRVRIEDRPGRLEEISSCIAEHGGNVRSVRHDRAVEELSIGEAYLIFEVVTAGREHAENIVSSIESAGYEVERAGGRNGRPEDHRAAHSQGGAE